MGLFPETTERGAKLSTIILQVKDFLDISKKSNEELDEIMKCLVKASHDIIQQYVAATGDVNVSLTDTFEYINEHTHSCRQMTKQLESLAEHSEFFALVEHVARSVGTNVIRTSISQMQDYTQLPVKHPGVKMGPLIQTFKKLGKDFHEVMLSWEHIVAYDLNDLKLKLKYEVDELHVLESYKAKIATSLSVVQETQDLTLATSKERVLSLMQATEQIFVEQESLTNGFLTAFDKSKTQQLSKSHESLKKACTDYEYAASIAGRQSEEKNEVIEGSKILILRSKAMSIKWGLYTLMARYKAGQDCESCINSLQSILW